jgi:hypothetical protein
MFCPYVEKSVKLVINSKKPFSNILFSGDSCSFGYEIILLIARSRTCKDRKSPQNSRMADCDITLVDPCLLFSPTVEKQCSTHCGSTYSTCVYTTVQVHGTEAIENQ